MSGNHKDHVGVYEYARELGFTVTHVYRQIQEGKLPAKKLGRKWQIKRTELDLRRVKP